MNSRFSSYQVDIFLPAFPLDSDFLARYFNLLLVLAVLLKNVKDQGRMMFPHINLWTFNRICEEEEAQTLKHV